jgi:hypothetical protein
MLVATLKAFRMPWPWIQHYGVPLQIDIAEDRQSASLLLGRIIPEQDKTADGESLYGAHYKIELKKKTANGKCRAWIISLDGSQSKTRINLAFGRNTHHEQNNWINWRYEHPSRTEGLVGHLTEAFVSQTGYEHSLST